jgi:hypothetical protein
MACQLNRLPRTCRCCDCRHRGVNAAACPSNACEAPTSDKLWAAAAVPKRHSCAGQNVRTGTHSNLNTVRRHQADMVHATCTDHDLAQHGCDHKNCATHLRRHTSSGNATVTRGRCRHRQGTSDTLPTRGPLEKAAQLPAPADTSCLCLCRALEADSGHAVDFSGSQVHVLLRKRPSSGSMLLSATPCLRVLYLVKLSGLFAQQKHPRM